MSYDDDWDNDVTTMMEGVKDCGLKHWGKVRGGTTHTDLTGFKDIEIDDVENDDKGSETSTEPNQDEEDVLVDSVSHPHRCALLLRTVLRSLTLSLSLASHSPSLTLTLAFLPSLTPSLSHSRCRFLSFTP